MLWSSESGVRVMAVEVVELDGHLQSHLPSPVAVDGGTVRQGTAHEVSALGHAR